MSMQETLAAGVKDLGLLLTREQQQSLLQYLELLQKWNKVYNLTAVRDPHEMLRLHLLDCLAVVPFFGAAFARAHEGAQGDLVSILDVGAGGGLPGVVLAICFPDVRVTCVDAVAKKMAFVQQVAANLPLPNLRAVHSRVELLVQQYPVITSRAFASLKDFVGITRPRLAPGGEWLAMKGKLPKDELAELPGDLEVFHVEQVHIPGVDALRCMVWMREIGGSENAGNC